ncbi:MAG: hypothetical protein ACFFDY_01335 [Candidatus Thorarchaeota archaeon]
MYRLKVQQDQQFLQEPQKHLPPRPKPLRQQKLPPHKVLHPKVHKRLKLQVHQQFPVLRLKLRLAQAVPARHQELRKLPPHRLQAPKPQAHQRKRRKLPYLVVHLLAHPQHLVLLLRQLKLQQVPRVQNPLFLHQHQQNQALAALLARLNLQQVHNLQLRQFRRVQVLNLHLLQQKQVLVAHILHLVPQHILLLHLVARQKHQRNQQFPANQLKPLVLQAVVAHHL